MDINLKMDEPVEKSRLDSTNQNIISRPIDRIDGPLKTTGAARYAAEFKFPGLVHGVLVGAPIGKGRVEAIDTETCRRAPGVLAVITDDETFLRNPAQGLDTEAPAQGVRDITYFGQPIALVVAETFEQARHAAQTLEVAYAPEAGRFDFDARRDTAQPKDSTVSHQGDLDAAMAAAHVTVDAVWTTPSQNSAAMEPHATTAVWDGDGVTLYGAYQMLSTNKLQAADALGLAPEKVRMIAHYVGGGFGSKLGIAPESIAAARRETARPSGPRGDGAPAGVRSHGAPLQYRAADPARRRP